jgi:hypothetical protein
MHSPRRRLTISVLLIPLLTLACASTISSTSATTIATTRDAPPQPTHPQEASTRVADSDFPLTPAIVSLGSGPGDAYVVDTENFVDQEFVLADLPVAPGSIEVRWYVSGDTLAALFIGLGNAQTDGLCLTTSAVSDDKVLFVSHRPIEQGGCAHIPSLNPDQLAPVLPCRDGLLFLTAIPADFEGTVYAHIDRFDPEKLAIAGMRSGAPIVPGIPELDVESVCR